MAVFIMAASFAVGIATVFAVSFISDPSMETMLGSDDPPMSLMLLAQLVMQVVTVVLVLWAARMFAGDRYASLSMVPLPGGGLTVLKSFVVLAIVSGVFTIYAWNFAYDDIIADVSELWPLMKGEYWWLMLLVAVVGAPLSEEILFRGYLQSALAKSQLGFWGAALLTNTAWTALHAGYTMTGLIDVFIAGLVFSWLLWRTGSLWVPIICHGLYNGVIFAVLSAVELPAGAPVGLPA
ncbi:MAG: CPBP family intramembrane metalloprotease [Alphaproteobacteria bacterium]|nr:CPBP family intramembrane metalloprotease [Alphaproteobacteria bacterium]